MCCELTHRSRTMLLTSAGFENPEIGNVFLRLLDKPVQSIKILFVPTAAITDGAKHCAKLCLDELLLLGIKRETIHVYDLDGDITIEEVRHYDAIYVCGGDTLHLLNRVRETGFDTILESCVDDGILYVGVSAGSILVGPRVRHTCGLNLIDVVIFPHYCDEAQERVRAIEASNYKVIPLTDMQAVLIKGTDMTILPAELIAASKGSRARQ